MVLCCTLLSCCSSLCPHEASMSFSHERMKHLISEEKGLTFGSSVATQQEQENNEYDSNNWSNDHQHKKWRAFRSGCSFCSQKTSIKHSQTENSFKIHQIIWFYSRLTEIHLCVETFNKTSTKFLELQFTHLKVTMKQEQMKQSGVKIKAVFPSNRVCHQQFHSWMIFNLLSTGCVCNLVVLTHQTKTCSSSCRWGQILGLNYSFDSF